MIHLFQLLVWCVIYILFGGLVISEIENPYAQIYLASEKATQERAFEAAGLTDAQVHTLRAFGLVQEVGISPWTFDGACFYCVTLVTTIGYGSFTPRTTPGRVFSCVYCLAGVLLLTYTMSHVATVLVDELTHIARALAHVYHPRRIDDDGKLTEYGRQRLAYEFERYASAETQTLCEEELAGFLTVLNDGRRADKRDVRFIIARANRHGGGDITFEEFESAIEAWYEQHPVRPQFENEAHAVIAFGLCLLSGALSTIVYCHTELWTRDEAAWFVFISMATVGFGDIVPETHTGRVWLAFFVVFDLGMLSYFVKSCLELASLKVNKEELEELQERLHTHVALPVDTTGDGVYDSIFVDTTGDGKLDFWAPLSTAGSPSPASPVWTSVGQVSPPTPMQPIPDQTAGRPPRPPSPKRAESPQLQPDAASESIRVRMQELPEGVSPLSPSSRTVTVQDLQSMGVPVSDLRPPSYRRLSQSTRPVVQTDSAAGFPAGLSEWKRSVTLLGPNHPGSSLRSDTARPRRRATVAAARVQKAEGDGSNGKSEYVGPFRRASMPVRPSSTELSLPVTRTRRGTVVRRPSVLDAAAAGAVHAAEATHGLRLIASGRLSVSGPAGRRVSQGEDSRLALGYGTFGNDAESEGSADDQVSDDEPQPRIPVAAASVSDISDEQVPRPAASDQEK